jgi:hypothetical protein
MMVSAVTKNPRTWLAVLVALHSLLAIYFFPINIFTEDAPIQRADYATHFYDAYAVSELMITGHSWGYDPYFMAGYPVGTVFDVDNKLVEAFVFAFSFLGQVHAYNLCVLLLFLAIPFVTYWTSRNFGFSPRDRSLAVLLTLGVWYFDPSVVTMRHVGMFTFAAAAYLSPWVVSLFALYKRQSTARNWLALTLALSLALWLHLLAFFILLVPMGLIYLQGFQKRRWVHHLSLAGTALLVLIINAYWLVPLVQFHHIITDTGTYFAGGVQALWNDLLQVGLAEGSEFPRTLIFRWMVFAFGVIGLYRWRRQSQGERALAIGGTLVWLATLAYLAGHIPGGVAIEPYRFIVPAIFFAVFPAATALGDPQLSSAISSSNRALKLGLAALALVVVLSLLNAFYYLHPRVERFWVPVSLEDRLTGPSRRQKGLFQWIKRNTDPNARILIQDWWTAALIPYFTGRQVIGGPYHPYFIQYAYANVGGDSAFGERIREISPTDFYEMLQAYNVQWVIVNPNMLTDKTFDLGRYAEQRRLPFVSSAATVRDFRIYRVDIAPTCFLKGNGHAEAFYNTIRVTGASPGSVVLKYHWLDTLKSEPPLELLPYPVLDDPPGFIQVNNGEVRDFVIYNGY